VCVCVYGYATLPRAHCCKNIKVMSTRLAFIARNDTIAAQNGTATSAFDAKAFQEQRDRDTFLDTENNGREIWAKRKLENGRDFCRVGNETIMFKRFPSRVILVKSRRVRVL